MRSKAIIVGGELRNRGAQAMTFRTILELRKRFPGLEPVLLSFIDTRPPLVMRAHQDFRHLRPHADIENLTFRIVWGDPTIVGPSTTGMGLAFKVRRMARNTLLRGEQPVLDHLIDESALCIDISGFAFGAQWGYVACEDWLTRLDVLSQRGVPTYVLPQSFGPFDFVNTRETEAIARHAAHTLALPRVIYAREERGLRDVRALCPAARVEPAEDIVLQGPEVDPVGIFADPTRVPTYPGIAPGHNVGIVPNTQNYRHGRRESLLVLYALMVEELLEAGYDVHVICHSEDDLVACGDIKSLFPTEARVVTHLEDRYCFQYADLFSACDFVVGSRFHAVVHALKVGTPCVVLGWDTKYVELMGRMGLSDFVHDVRSLDDETMAAVLASVHEVAERHGELSNAISACVAELQAGPSVYDAVAEDFRGLSG